MLTVKDWDDKVKVAEWVKQRNETMVRGYAASSAEL